MNAESVSLASITPLTIAPRQLLSRESAARIAGHTVMAWRYERLPANADGRLTLHYKQAVVDGWLESGDLTSSFELWMNLKIYVAGDVACSTLCAHSPQPRFAGAGLLTWLDLDDDAGSCESFNILWHAADAEEMMGRPVLRTAVLQVFDALRRQPTLNAAEIKALLSWDELSARHTRDGGRESLEQAAADAGEDWQLRQRSIPHGQRNAAE